MKSCFTATISNTVALPKQFEFLALKELGLNNHATIVGIYRPPSAVAGSLVELAGLPSFVVSVLVIMGDFNLEWLTDVSDHF